MQRGDIYLSAVEEEIVQGHINAHGCTEIIAVEAVVQSKVHAAYDWARQGECELAEQLMQEAGKAYLIPELPCRKRLLGPDGKPL